MAARLLFDRALHVSERRIRIPGAERHGRRVHPLGGRLRAGRPLRGLAFADAEIELGSFDELPLLRVPLEDLAEGFRGAGVVMPLEPADTGFVDTDRFVETRLLGWRW